MQRLKSCNADLCAEAERLSRELADARSRHDADQRDIAELRAQQRRALVAGRDIAGGGSGVGVHDWLAMFDSAVAKYEAAKRDHDSLRTRHADALAQLTAASSKVRGHDLGSTARTEGAQGIQHVSLLHLVNYERNEPIIQDKSNQLIIYASTNIFAAILSPTGPRIRVWEKSLKLT